MMTGNSTEYIEIPGLEGVGVVRHSGTAPTGTRHAHRSVCMGAVLSGSRVVAVRSERYAAPVGTVQVIPPEVVHTCVDHGPVEYLLVSIACACFDRAGMGRPALGGVPFTVELPDRFRAVLRLADMVERPASRLERQASLMTVIAPLGTDGAPEPAEKPDRIEAVRRLLEERAVEDLPLESLAEIAGCSPWRLNRVFAHTVGMPPHEYQTMQRVRLVTACIRSGMGLAESADEAGFFDQSHMTRCFGKFMGMTPGAFAAGVKGAGGMD